MSLHAKVDYTVQGVTVHDCVECVSSACHEGTACMTKLLVLYHAQAPTAQMMLVKNCTCRIGCLQTALWHQCVQLGIVYSLWSSSGTDSGDFGLHAFLTNSG